MYGRRRLSLCVCIQNRYLLKVYINGTYDSVCEFLLAEKRSFIGQVLHLNNICRAFIHIIVKRNTC